MSRFLLLSTRLQRFFPFLSWFPISALVLRADLIAGITGALVLVPKAMAYAQLSGLPVHYGLYVAFVPAILGALWGSSRQLATGPVAVISLMTAAALTPLAVPFSDHYIELALLLTLMVGVIQFLLGALKLGTIVNFISHPAILGFMNAAAVIIALSQLDLLLGIHKGRSDYLLADAWEMLGQLPRAHLPTLAMALFSLALMLGFKRLKPLAKPSTLLAVVIATAASWLVGFDRSASAHFDQIADLQARQLVLAHADATQRISEIGAEIPALSSRLRAAERSDARTAAALRYELHMKQLDIAALKAGNESLLRDIQQFEFKLGVPKDGEAPMLYLPNQIPPDAETSLWRWHVEKIGTKQTLQIKAGGDVVGHIPQGLPELRLPSFSLEAFVALLSAAIVIALMGFMESIAMAKAMAVQSGQKINPNQELLGQGIANLGGSLFQSYPACGSFTGSVINLQAGAKTGLAMIFNGLFVVATLLFLTPYLYHLPKATLGVIILLAVTSLLTPKSILLAWKASRADGVVAAVTFITTLLAAPHLDKGLLTGAALAILLYLYRTMRPRVVQLGRHPDGALRDIRAHPNLPTSASVLALRFDDGLYFANASFFEEAMLSELAGKPGVRYILCVANGINYLDASGEEVLRQLIESLRQRGISIVFSGLKKQVTDVMRRTGLYETLGADHIFPDANQALHAIYNWLGPDSPRELLQPAAQPES